MEFNSSKALFNMVEQQIKPWGVLDTTVLNLLFKIHRDKFVMKQYSNLAYSDVELPLPDGGKMLCPRLEARMLQELKIKKTDKVLQIATGSGYVTALLAALADFVYSVDSSQTNLAFAKDNLVRSGCKNVNLAIGADFSAFVSQAPFDKIFVGGALHSIDSRLLSMLKVGGLMCGVFGKGDILEASIVEKIASDNIKITKLFETKIDYLIDSTCVTSFRL